MDHPEESPFWQAALRSGLIDARQLRGFWDEIPPEKREAETIDRRLARRAIQAEVLTLWQAQQLLKGRYKGLRTDKFVLLDLLGQGGTGRVFLARDTRLHRVVALKILSRDRHQSPRALARFDREIKVAAQLQHEHLVRIYNEGEIDGLRYLVMEYIDGLPLSRLIWEHGRIPPPVAAELARQVAVGLDYLLKTGLLHRDVNPSNIMVDRSGTAKLTDFGLALDLDDPNILTREGATIGTFEYLSPEQAWSSRSIDIRSDIYSLGCTLYHMIAGHVPFPGGTPVEVLLAHQKVAPTPLATLVPDCPPGLDTVVLRMMSKAPADRYQRPTEIIQALLAFTRGPVPLDRIASIAAPAAAPPSDRPDAGAEHAGAGASWASTPDSEAGVYPSTTSESDVFTRIDLEPESPSGETASATWESAVWIALVVSVLSFLALWLSLLLQ